MDLHGIYTVEAMPKASTKDEADAKAEDKPKFTEKEEAVLKAAWSCLKSGAPEIDIAKLTVAAGFNTEKTAANTWGTIKKKLGLVKAVATSSPKSNTPKKQDTPAKKGITPTKKGVTPIKKGIARPVKRKHSHDDDEFPDGGASPIRRASNKKVKNDFVVEDDAED